MPVLRQIGMAAIAAVVAAQAATHAAAEEGGPDEPLLIALSTQRIEIDSNFAGTSILLFGATDVVGDVVVSVRGPEEPVVVRRKRQTVGVWINQESIAFRNVPGYYFVAASRPLEEIAPAEFLDRKQLGSERLLLEAIWFDTSGDANEFRAALHRDRERDSLYRSEPGVVEFIDERLFRTTIDLPAHVPTGDYVVEGAAHGRRRGAQHALGIAECREGRLLGGHFHLRAGGRSPLRRHCYRAGAGGRMGGQLRLPQGLRTRRNRCHD